MTHNSKAGFSQRGIIAELNALPTTEYQLRVVEKIGLRTDDKPDNLTNREWEELIEDITSDPHTTFQRGVFWLAGRVNKMTRQEATLLLYHFPDHFEAKNEAARIIVKALKDIT